MPNIKMDTKESKWLLDLQKSLGKIKEPYNGGISRVKKNEAKTRAIESAIGAINPKQPANIEGRIVGDAKENTFTNKYLIERYGMGLPSGEIHPTSAPEIRPVREITPQRPSGFNFSPIVRGLVDRAQKEMEEGSRDVGSLFSSRRKTGMGRLSAAKGLIDLANTLAGSEVSAYREPEIYGKELEYESRVPAMESERAETMKTLQGLPYIGEATRASIGLAGAEKRYKEAEAEKAEAEVAAMPSSFEELVGLETIKKGAQVKTRDITNQILQSYRDIEKNALDPEAQEKSMSNLKRLTESAVKRGEASPDLLNLFGEGLDLIDTKTKIGDKNVFFQPSTGKYFKK